MTSTGKQRVPEQRAADPPEALRLVAAALSDRKAVDPVVLDLRGLTAATDYFVIVSGTSDAHVRGMAEHLLATLAPGGVRPHHIEGLPQGRWVLLDYVDFVVHVFHPELRDFYQLERLWGDAPAVPTAPEGGSKG
jgi:ribosome-associated protein